jgi:hypothetical protein
LRAIASPFQKKKTIETVPKNLASKRYRIERVSVHLVRSFDVLKPAEKMQQSGQCSVSNGASESGHDDLEPAFFEQVNVGVC